MIINLAG